jgi:hypothetical protein
MIPTRRKESGGWEPSQAVTSLSVPMAYFSRRVGCPDHPTSSPPNRKRMNRMRRVIPIMCGPPSLCGRWMVSNPRPNAILIPES